MPGKNLNLFIDEELIKEAKKAAIELDTSLSKIVSELLIEFITKHKEKAIK